MKTSLMKGLSFGLTSGIITTLGMMVGLFAGAGSKLVVLGGVLSIAIADSFSDALGIHVSEESDHNNTHKHIWAATSSTFISKLLFSSTFILPVLLFNLKIAIVVSIIYGLSLLCLLSYFIAISQNNNPVIAISEHLFIAILVIIITYYVGHWINHHFS